MVGVWAAHVRRRQGSAPPPSAPLTPARCRCAHIRPATGLAPCTDPRDLRYRLVPRLDRSLLGPCRAPPRRVAVCRSYY